MTEKYIRQIDTSIKLCYKCDHKAVVIEHAYNIFGGTNNSELFVTSATKSMSIEEMKKYKYSGALFKIKTNIRGIENIVWIICKPLM